eukprot:SAG31_NODE_155_length_22130_cov_9.540098_22_plen_261_part_00
MSAWWGARHSAARAGPTIYMDTLNIRTDCAFIRPSSRQQRASRLWPAKRRAMVPDQLRELRGWFHPASFCPHSPAVLPGASIASISRMAASSCAGSASSGRAELAASRRRLSPAPAAPLRAAARAASAAARTGSAAWRRFTATGCVHTSIASKPRAVPRTQIWDTNLPIIFNTSGVPNLSLGGSAKPSRRRCRLHWSPTQCIDARCVWLDARDGRRCASDHALMQSVRLSDTCLELHGSLTSSTSQTQCRQPADLSWHFS